MLETDYVDCDRFSAVICKGNRDVALRFAARFFDSNSSNFFELREALDKDNIESTRNPLHHIKLSAGTVGAVALLTMTNDILNISLAERMNVLKGSYDAFHACFLKSYQSLVQVAEHYPD